MNVPRITSLASRLTLLAVCLVIGTGVLTGWLGYTTARVTVREQTRKWLSGAVAIYESMVAGFLEDFDAALRRLSRDEAILEALEAYAGGTMTREALRALCHPRLVDHVNDTAPVLAILLVDLEGKVLAASDQRQLADDFRHHPSFASWAGGMHVSEPVLAGSKYQALVAAPVRSVTGVTRALAVIQFDWTALARVLTTPKQLGETGEVLLATRRGETIEYLLRSPASAPGVSAADRAILEGSGFIDTVDDRGRPVLAAFRHVGRGHWGLVVRVAADEVYGPVRRLRALVVASTALLLLIAITMAHVVARRIARPVHDMALQEDRLRFAAKMEALGTLAAGVAHHFSNMLQVMLGHTEGLERAVPPDHPQRGSIDTIFRTGDRASQLVRQMLRFARRDRPEASAVDVGSVVGSTADMLRPLLPERVRLVLEVAPHLPMVRMDPRDLEEMLVNLTINARDSIEAEGEVRIRVEGETSSVQLTVSDTGCGMDEASLARIFEPFFTTKGPERGTGLGLPIVYGIVQRAEGSIDVTSQPGRGTTVHIRLPGMASADRESLLPDLVANEEDPPAGGDETILVIEDHAELREMIVESLGALGYTVLEARSLEEARSIQTVWTETIDLLVTDVSPFPGLREVPGLRVIEVAGPGGPDGEARDQGHTVLRKPFRLQALRRLVRETLDRRPP